MFAILGSQTNALAQHQMQHGFILSNNDQLASHLVANGHHSRQTEIVGQLTIHNVNERAFYQQRKNASAVNQTYFLFQAQQLDLPRLSAGYVLTGHIIESKIGGYEPKNIVVRSATFRVQKVLLNIANPFFIGQSDNFSRGSTNSTPRTQKPHCCDDPSAKVCNWKC